MSELNPLILVRPHFIENIAENEQLLYADTDSVVEDSIINVDGKDIEIQTFFENDGTLVKNEKDNFVKKFNKDYYTWSFDKKTKSIVSKKIVYCMKHKVKKRMFKISTYYTGHNVIITEDHSIIINRFGKFVDIKPSDIRTNDSCIIHHKNLDTEYFFTNIEVEDLGIKEEWVYDIEVEDNHNFFANNILVHNSAYLMYNLPFNKFQDIYQLVSYIQGLARELGKLYNESLNYYGTFANLDPEYNTMDFKSEVVAYRGFLGGKKFYGLAKCWDEGTFFNEKPKVKKTGGQIVKADVTPLTKAMLEEIYDVLITQFDIVDLGAIYQKIFIVIKNKYMMMIKKELSNFNINEFSTPKKWGDTKKSTPPHVYGAKLFNAIIRDTFRPTDSFIMIKIQIDPYRLIDYLKTCSNQNEFALSVAEATELKSKINVLCVPTHMPDEDKELLNIRLRELNIQLDFQDIINFNINMKLDPYVKLFPEKIRNMYS